MAEADYSAYNPKEYPLKDIAALRISIISSEWNTEIIDMLESACLKELEGAGVSSSHIKIHKVPGSFELPMGAKLVLGSAEKQDAIICLGCVIQGETKHDDYINHTIARSINQINLVSGIPVIFGVLTTNTREQAIARADGSHGSKGAESATAALKMISLKESLSAKAGKISF